MKAVIFDFNGTLFRDSEFHNTAWTSFAARHGKSLKPEDLDKHIHGFTNKEIIEYFFERSLSFEEAQPYYEEKRLLTRHKVDLLRSCLVRVSKSFFVIY